MATKYHVTVARGYRWPRATIAGREFAKNVTVTLAEHEFSDEIARAASKEYGILEIKVIYSEDGVDATEGARALAEAEGVDLDQIGGSGQGGRIVKRDVEAYLAWLEEVQK